jgi:hypothetical protein
MRLNERVFVTFIRSTNEKTQMPASCAGIFFCEKRDDDALLRRIVTATEVKSLISMCWTSKFSSSRANLGHGFHWSDGR